MTIFDALGPTLDTSGPKMEVGFSGRKRRRRFFSGRMARSDWVYDFADICELYRVSINTPGNWVKEGLRLIDDLKPHAARGSELNRFHGERQRKAKRPLQPHEFFCRSCGGPKEPEHGSIYIDSSQRGAACIIAVCPDCGKRIDRFAGPSGVEAFRARYKLDLDPAWRD